MKKFKGLLIIMLVALFIFSGVGGGAVFAADAQEIDINVDQDDLLDIVLTLGNDRLRRLDFGDGSYKCACCKGRSRR